MSLLHTIYAQDLTINEYLKSTTPAEKKFNFLFQLDNRRSFVFDKPVKFSGMRIGLEYKEVHDFGLGFYGPVNPVRVKYTKPNYQNELAEVEAAFNYTTVFYQFAFYHNEHWEIATPIHLGRGTADIRVINSETDSLIFRKDGLPELDERKLPFTISEMGLDIQYKYSWLGVGGGIGYRFLVGGDARQRNLFDGVTYSVKLKILFGVIYKAFNKHFSYEETYKRKH